MSRRGEKSQAYVSADLRRRHGSLSVYDILGTFREASAKVAPTTICRALAALIERGCQQHVLVLSICDAGQMRA
ncbi:MAG: hypothetical protein AAF414_22660 [Pseudomonadota bacterium]